MQHCCWVEPVGGEGGGRGATVEVTEETGGYKISEAPPSRNVQRRSRAFIQSDSEMLA